MSIFRVVVGTALLANTLICCGCSDSSSKPAVSSPPVVTQQTPPSVPAPASNPPPAVRTESAQRPPATAPKTDATPASGDSEVKGWLAQINELKEKPIQARSRADLNTILGNQKTILDLAEKVLAAKLEASDRDQARESGLQAIGLMSQFDPRQRSLLDKVDKLAEATLADTPAGPLAATAMFIRAMTHLNIERDGSENDPSINKRLFAMAKEFTEKSANDPRSGQLLYMIGENALMDGQNDTALEALKFTVEQDSSSQFGQTAAGKIKLLEAVGKPPEIAGPTIDGSEIDITQFKGKVVLVDFWATWCGPCIAELPNVKAVYEKYHEQGFEVLAVSFDQTKDALTRYVEQNKLPWPQIFFDEDGKRFWQNPLGQKYGINSIPATFLVDRDGNLQKIGVRGAALEPAVAEMLKGTKAPAAN
jgi:thiol-disulfide isomerase/thioredoxin